MFASMIHFDKSVQLEWHYNEVGYGKSVTDSVGRTIKGAVWVGEIKPNHDKHSGRIWNGSPQRLWR